MARTYGLDDLPIIRSGGYQGQIFDAWAPYKGTTKTPSGYWNAHFDFGLCRDVAGAINSPEGQMVHVTGIIRDTILGNLILLDCRITP
jgi:hypothetical protein